ncbi:energy-coupling factor ABC transporter ATP-binding protein [Bacillus salitolerans]|uniref:Energy-coupling factor transporter ATP-binding protein EcfA2 n=1 Tax=Bacillus salitolerans TaxID=1437434 RepID=A0ABW4LT27_9BACI
MDINIQKLTHRYQANSPFERLALVEVDLAIPSGTFVSIIGHTGSGKSTVIQHLNALLMPTKGTIQIGEFTLTPNKKDKQIKSLRKKVGMVFQFPEHQLFEETIEKDICFGPMNFGVSEKEAKGRARKALSLVGLSEEFLDRSPFELSGGQMRRVAIAGVLAMEPEVIILDEPTAGLDPRGQKEMLELFSTLHKQRNLTTIMITHSMEYAAAYSDLIIVMEKGRVYLEGTPHEVFSQKEKLAQVGLDIPEPYQFIEAFEKTSNKGVEGTYLTIDEMVEAIYQFLQKENRL